MNVTLVWRTDVHMADEGPASRTDDWAKTVLGKLDQIGRIATEVNAIAVIDGGDFFHVKSPVRNSHEVASRVAEVHNKYPCPTFANVGNHDCKYGDLAFLPEQPLNVLFTTGVFKRLYDDHEVFFGPGDSKSPKAYPCINGVWLDGDPFSVVSDGTPIVRVVGIPYHGTKYDLTRFSSIIKGPEDHLVVIAHVLASQSGGTMFESEDIVQYADLLNLCPQASVFAFGHWHKDQGVTEIASGKFVVNIGSLTRGSISQDDQVREPAVAILRFSCDGPPVIQVRRLDVALASQVFDLSARVEAETRTQEMEAFADGIRATISANRGPSLEDTVRNMPNLADPIKELALGFLEEAKV